MAPPTGFEPATVRAVNPATRPIEFRWNNVKNPASSYKAASEVNEEIKRPALVRAAINVS